MYLIQVRLLRLAFYYGIQEKTFVMRTTFFFTVCLGLSAGALHSEDSQKFKQKFQFTKIDVQVQDQEESGAEIGGEPVEIGLVPTRVRVVDAALSHPVRIIREIPEADVSAEVSEEDTKDENVKKGEKEKELLVEKASENPVDHRPVLIAPLADVDLADAKDVEPLNPFSPPFVDQAPEPAPLGLLPPKFGEQSTMANSGNPANPYVNPNLPASVSMYDLPNQQIQKAIPVSGQPAQAQVPNQKSPQLPQNNEDGGSSYYSDLETSALLGENLSEPSVRDPSSVTAGLEPPFGADASNAWRFTKPVVGRTW